MTGLVLKLLFKATLPLMLLVGALSYGVHLRGGDPLAILRSVGAGMGEQLTELAGSATSGVRDGIDAASAVTTGERAGLTRVFSWQDADGVTHYSTEAPGATSAAVRTLSIDPDVNVLAPVRAPARVVTSAGSPTSNRAPGEMAAPDPAAQPDPVPMPGMAGLTGGGVSPEQATRLLKLLQGQ